MRTKTSTIVIMGITTALILIILSGFFLPPIFSLGLSITLSPCLIAYLAYYILRSTDEIAEDGAHERI